MMRMRGLLLLVALISVVGCSSGDKGDCDTDDGTALAASDWPKFRKDLANTGHVDATIPAAQGERWVFPAREAAPLDNAATSPVLLSDGRILVVAGQAGLPTVNRAYLIRPDTGQQDGSFDIPLSSTASVSPGSTPVISQSRIAIMFTDGSVRQFDLGGTFINSLPANGAVTGSLTIDHEGTIYTGAINGVYTTLCASGGARYLVGIGATESSAALYEGNPLTTDDDVSVIASNDGKVRAFTFEGELLWTFTAAAAVRASVVYDAPNGLVYGADASGLVFALQAKDGRRCRNLTLNLGAPIAASPAFANGRLYVVDTGGVLHALGIEAACDTASESPATGLVERWTYTSGASVSSSPALAASGDGNPVVVFGSDDGTVHAVIDQDSSGTALWTHCTEERGAFGRSSAAIASDGTVYVTTAAGRLYAIGAGTGTSMPCSTMEEPTPTVASSASPSPSPTNTPQP